MPFTKGYIPWNKDKVMGNKGWKHTEESRNKMRLSRLGVAPWNKGKKGIYSEEYRLKISSALRNRQYSVETRIKMSEAHKGDKAPNWKGGVSPKNWLIRSSIEYRLWRESVFSRDHWNCQNCGERGYMHAHHIKPFSKYPELRFAIDNGITLCKQCHKQLHQAKETPKE